MPGNNEIDSQESDLFEPLNDNNFVKDPFDNVDGGNITNLTFTTDDSAKKDVVAQENQDKEEMTEEEDNVVLLMSPGKIIHKTTKFAEIPPEPSEGQQELIHGILCEWVNTQGTELLPPLLASLAACVGVSMEPEEPNPSTPGWTSRRGKQEKPISPAKVATPSKAFEGQRFVLSGMWPGLVGSQGLTLGKDMVKAIIEQHSRKVSASFLHLTNFLVIGEAPGPKKVLGAHEKGIQIVEVDQVNSIIFNNNMTVKDLSCPYPETALTILEENGIQVKRPPPPSDPLEQCTVGTSTDLVVHSQEDGSGAGHRDE
jgi:hypothetical protein